MPIRCPRRSLLAVFTLALCACGSLAGPPVLPASGVAAAAGADDRATRTIALAPGEQVALDGGSLRFLRVVNDSRCAPDVQCVWAGDAEIALTWTPTGGAPRGFSLHTGVEPRQQALGDGRSVRLLDLARGPTPTARMALRATP